MKTNLLLCFLLLAVSCDGSRGKKRKAKNVSTPEITKAVDNTVTLQSPKRGVVAIETSNGSAPGIHLTKNEIYSSPVQTITKTIILKSEGELVYKYRELIDLSRDVVSKTVILENSVEDLKSLMTNENCVKKDGNISYTTTKEMEDSLNSGTVVVTKSTTTGTINLKNHLCDYKTVSTQNIELIVKGEKVKSLSLKNDSTSNCSEISSEELKKIDLSEILFCDKTASERDCELRDMSFITSDL